MNFILATILACTTTDDTAAYAPYAGDTGDVSSNQYVYELAGWWCDAPDTCNGEFTGADCIFLIYEGMMSGIIGSHDGYPGYWCINAETARMCISWVYGNPVDEACDFSVLPECALSAIHPCE